MGRDAVRKRTKYGRLGGRAGRIAIAILMALCAAPVARADGDAEAGSALARQWCAACHVVGSGQATASADVPTFFEIARDPLMNEAVLAAFLADPHPRMPDMALSRREVADLVAYILSLR